MLTSLMNRAEIVLKRKITDAEIREFYYFNEEKAHKIIYTAKQELDILIEKFLETRK